TIDTALMRPAETPYQLVRMMRASISVMGPLLARFGTAKVAMPGGCNIGSRKIDLHIQGLRELGVDFSFSHGYIEARADRLRGARINLSFPSVGATENILMAAVAAAGTTCIENAAREPEIQDLVWFLRSMGAQISGEGTPTIEVEGGHDLHGTDYSVIGDRIEAGTYLVAGAVAGGGLKVEGIKPAHLGLVLDKLAETGIELEIAADSVSVRRSELRSADVQTLPFPGFPTDLQPQLMVLLSLARGTSIMTENVFESRFMFVDELNRMGCDIRTEGHHAVVRGVTSLSGAEVCATDLRAGAALVIAGLAAEGVTEVCDIHHIDRGYESLEHKLSAVGADITRERNGSDN
ncbi:MAG: UDP-N-acetylglucosamine 1-carboxyvinyltransferase, partial [Candidatus Geothermincolia bacterium]